MASATLAPARGLDRQVVTRWLQNNGVYAAIVALLVYNAAFTANFVSTGNLRTQLIQASPIIIVALGMALVIGTEGVDLSVGSVMALSAALIPLYIGYGAVGAIAIALVGGALVGLVNGGLIAFVGLQPIVATLALLVGGRGLALVLADGQLKQINDKTILDLGGGEVAGIPTIVLIAAVLVVLVGFLVQRTTFGRQLVAVGGNRAAGELAGLPVKRVLVTVYVLSGVLAAIAGVVATGRLTASDPSTIGQLIELSAITAVVVGGTPLTGGRVRIVGTVMGALLMQLLFATLTKHNVSDSRTQMIQAAIIVLAVLVQRGRGAAR